MDRRSNYYRGGTARRTGRPPGIGSGIQSIKAQELEADREAARNRPAKDGYTWRRMDLHIHTPASSDYRSPGVTYLDILKKAEEKNLDMIAFSDHNSVAGYGAMQREIETLTLLERLGRATEDERVTLAEYRRLLAKITVLPGFEFTATFGFHILGIFPENTSIRKLEHLLLNLNVPEEKMVMGAPDAGSTTDVLSAYAGITAAGGMAIAAHANSSNGVAMQGFPFGGQTKIAYTQDVNLIALEVTDLEAPGRRSTPFFYNGSKGEYPRRMHCIQGSDAHSVETEQSDSNNKRLGVGARITEIYVKEASFAALKELLLEEDYTRTRAYRSNLFWEQIEDARKEGAGLTQSFHERAVTKTSRTRPILHDVQAFANGDGGVIYVGVNPDVSVPMHGLERPQDYVGMLREDIQNTIDPPIEVGLDIRQNGERGIIVVTVPGGEECPYVFTPTGQIYVRYGNETALAGRDEIVRLVLESAREGGAPAPTFAARQPALPVPARPDQSEFVETPLPPTSTARIVSIKHIPDEPVVQAQQQPRQTVRPWREERVTPTPTGRQPQPLPSREQPRLQPQPEQPTLREEQPRPQAEVETPAFREQPRPQAEVETPTLRERPRPQPPAQERAVRVPPLSNLPPEKIKGRLQPMTPRGTAPTQLTETSTETTRLTEAEAMEGVRRFEASSDLQTTPINVEQLEQELAAADAIFGENMPTTYLADYGEAGMGDVGMEADTETVAEAAALEIESQSQPVEAEAEVAAPKRTARGRSRRRGASEPTPTPEAIAPEGEAVEAQLEMAQPMEATVSAEHLTREEIVAEVEAEKPKRGGRRRTGSRKAETELQVEAPTAAAAASEAGAEAILVEAEIEPGPQIPAELPSETLPQEPVVEEAAPAKRSSRSRRKPAAQPPAEGEATIEAIEAAPVEAEEPAPAKGRRGGKGGGGRKKEGAAEKVMPAAQDASDALDATGTLSMLQLEAVDPPKTGVAIISTETREGKLYHTMSDLRNASLVHNVTRQSARRLWHYAILQHERGAPALAEVLWHPDHPSVGLWRRGNRAGALRFDLVSRLPDGSFQIYYGVTEDGLTGPWADLPALAESVGYVGPAAIEG